MKLFAVAAFTFGVAGAQTIYVAPNGRDAWSGRIAAPNAFATDGPVASPSAARDAARALHRNNPAAQVTIALRGGVYRLPETLVLSREDSGVEWTAYQHERAEISGGRVIGGWTKADKGPLWTARVPAGWNFRQLFVSGRRAQRARTPNAGFYRIDGPSSQDKPFQLRFHGSEIRADWAGKGVEAIALLAWADIRMPIVSVDEARHVAILRGNPRPSNKEKDARFYIENAPDALDSPGEWYLDLTSNTVSYWPVAGERMAEEEVVAPALLELVRIEGARQIAFRDVTFTHTDWSMPADGYADTQAAIAVGAAFEAAGAENVAVERCVFRSLGGYAISFGKGSKHNRIAHNQIYDVGAGGVKIGETVLREAEADRNYANEVTDNDIHHLGVVFPPAVGLWVGQSSDNILSHNHIHDLYYTAISVGWTWGYGPNQCKGNKIEYNHLHHIGQDMLSDMGAIYTLGIQPGTTIRNNLIHDVWSFTYGGWGIYPDEGSTGILIENNLVYRTKSAGFHQHYGRENTVRNNIFAFGHEFQLMRTRAEPHRSFTFEKNIVYFDSGRLLGSNWTGEGFRLADNIFYDARGSTIPPPPNAENSVFADPLFVDAGGYNFHLRPESPALKLGFRQIDLSEVGPR